MKPSPKDFKVPMPTPKIFDPVLQCFGRLAPYFAYDVTVSLTQQPYPGPIRRKRRFNFSPPAIRNPKSSINHEPRGV